MIVADARKTHGKKPDPSRCLKSPFTNENRNRGGGMGGLKLPDSKPTCGCCGAVVRIIDGAVYWDCGCNVVRNDCPRCSRKACHCRCPKKGEAARR